MKWTKEKPIGEGWYWQKRSQGKYEPKEINIVYVRWYGGKLCIMNSEIPDDVEWAGFLPEPED